ncbi:uncharacterized protein FA14DRAFT_159840 [Meira miltonrushii]|uniref:Low temperature requirement A n=1 Tax=Meira miltonrushii TaxID=1280837 RepID=A0A316VRJ4_9BASI|nr:uncharacterized protein FA14DRAFT_159840 [Meira miltonrushii]PWN38115.1 hypothetical protein FA14DRAFT_159840 [Meira miltonrushii]
MAETHQTSLPSEEAAGSTATSSSQSQKAPPLLTHSSSGHAHHLKWGEIETSGFAPPTLNPTDEHVETDTFCTKLNPTDRRQRMTKDHTRELLDSEARKIHANRRYLFRRPRPLQYFRGNVLVRSEEERGSGRLELFFDLTFVGIIAVLAQSAVADPTGPGFVRYILTYTAAFLVWNWMRETFDAFYKDDLSQRILVLFVMACLVLYGNNAPEVQKDLSESPARAVTIGSYLIAEAAIFGTWLLYSFYIKAYRIQIRALILAWIASTALMIGAIFVPIRAAIALSVVAMVLVWWSWILFYSPIFKKLMRLRYSSAIAIDHEIERYQDFFTIVMGEFVYSLFDGSPAGIGFHAKAGKAIMALIIAFSFQLMYMNGGWSKKITHPLRYSVWHATGFLFLHLPVVSALTLCGDALADFIKEDRVPSGVRWLACESFAVGMIALWMLAMLEHERDEKGELWLPRWARLLPRLCSGIIVIFLPLTYQGPPEHEEGESSDTAAHIVGIMARQATQILAEAGTEGNAEAPAEGEVHHSGIEMTTIKLLGIMTALAFFSLLWETITSLDGPNAPPEEASEEIMQHALNSNGIVSALSTGEWRGCPRLCEPGSGMFDHSHQRKDASQLTPTTTVDTDADQA